jgi:hypothetical protein
MHMIYSGYTNYGALHLENWDTHLTPALRTGLQILRCAAPCVSSVNVSKVGQFAHRSKAFHQSVSNYCWKLEIHFYNNLLLPQSQK